MVTLTALSNTDILNTKYISYLLMEGVQAVEVIWFNRGTTWLGDHAPVQLLIHGHQLRELIQPAADPWSGIALHFAFWSMSLNEANSATSRKVDKHPEF